MADNGLIVKRADHKRNAIAIPNESPVIQQYTGLFRRASNDELMSILVDRHTGWMTLCKSILDNAAY